MMNMAVHITSSDRQQRFSPLRLHRDFHMRILLDLHRKLEPMRLVDSHGTSTTSPAGPERGRVRRIYSILV